MAELMITLPDGQTLRQPLGDEPMVIGRDAGCDIPIDDPSASRRHARFLPTPDGYTVEDMGSKNGTLVNDSPCNKEILCDGDRVLVGSAMVVYRDESESQTTGSVVVADDDLTRTHATRYVSRDQSLALSQRRLEMIYELSAKLTTLQDRETLLDGAMDICMEMLKFERGAIGIRQKQGRGVDWPVVRNLRGVEGELKISRSLLSRALEHGERAIFTDSGIGNADPTMSIAQHGIRSAMCVPLTSEDDILGVIYGDLTSMSASYKDEDIDFFAAIAQQISIGLINSNLLADQKLMIRLKHDIDIARSIQNDLFPKVMPDRDNFQVAAVNDPGDRISGDYYDVIEREDGRVWCLIADVTGEGVPAAMLMANLQSAVRITVDQSDDPSELFRQWNNLIFRNTDPSKFITGLLALVDPVKKTISMASAGHCSPILIRKDAKPEVLEFEPSFPLGIVEGATFDTVTMELGPDPCLILCYTDGVIEAMNPEEKFYGMEHLVETASEQTDYNAATLVKKIRKSVSTFSDGAKQSDDITVMAFRIG